MKRIPLEATQTLHGSNALRGRIFIYVTAVIALSSIFSFTKFFEAEIAWSLKNDTLTNTTVWKPSIGLTELRNTPWYIMYRNWSRLLLKGVIPFVMIVYLNAHTYKNIKARTARSSVPRSEVSQSTHFQSTQFSQHNQRNANGRGTGRSMNVLYSKKSSKTTLTALQISGDKVTVIVEPNTATLEMETIENTVRNGSLTSVHSNNTSNAEEDIIIQQLKIGPADVEDISRCTEIEDNATSVENIQEPMIELGRESVATLDKSPGNFLNT